MTTFDMNYRGALTWAARVVLTLGLAATLMGCGDDEEESTGTAPEISNLTYTMPTLTVGSANAITGGLDFTDPDGDVQFLNISLTLPDGQVQEIQPTATQGTNGVNAGSVEIAVALIVPQPGEYTLTFWLTDSEGNLSNMLTGTLTAADTNDDGGE